MSDLQLLPCPFCGNASTSDAPILVYHSEDLDIVYVCCEACDAQGPAIIVGIHPIVDQIDVAEAKWNKRAGQPDSYIPANQDVPF